MSSSPNTLSVFQWNTWYRAEPRRVASHILRIADKHGLPDVLCLQELTQPAVELVADAVEARDISYVVTRRHRNGIVEGQAIMSRNLFSNLMGVEVVLLSSGGRTPLKGGAMSSRVLQKARLSVGGQQITIGNTHLSYATPTNAELRREQRAVLEEAIAGEEPIVLVGDFNASPKSHTVKRLSELLVRAEQDQATWTSVHVDRIGLLRRNLDHVFTAGVEVVEVQVLDQGLSDHRPILTKIMVTEN